MEKRNSKRVQFYQLDTGRQIQPVWVFSRHDSDSILGLVLDVASGGAQILTSKSQELKARSYQLIIHLSENVTEVLQVGRVQLRWSRPESSLYQRNGFRFDKQIQLETMISAFDSGSRWFRCELLPSHSQATA